MTDIIKFTFDLFAHVIPGLLILAALSVLTITNPIVTHHITEPVGDPDYGLITQIMTNIDTGQGILVTLIAYIVGFAVSPFGKNMYKFIGKRLWPHIVAENDIKGMHISDKFILIRQHSPANFEYVERWNMYSSLSHNLAVACLVVFGVSVFELFSPVIGDWKMWIGVAFVAVILFFVFIKSATVYAQWAGRDLNSAISALHLREKAKEGLD